jgi:hypothetical protein
MEFAGKVWVKSVLTSMALSCGTILFGSASEFSAVRSGCERVVSVALVASDGLP